jgi:hypothetical protein
VLASTWLMSTSINLIPALTGRVAKGEVIEVPSVAADPRSAMIAAGEVLPDQTSRADILATKPGNYGSSASEALR